ncbi:MAG: ABC transporter ATP-binding protein [Chloroflexi bacterium]|nr:ABC transporter ATP-binding protein [Chloroflexota bacterium]
MDGSGAAPRAGATVEYRQVTKRFGSGRAAAVAAVAELSFTVPAGSICALVGPSGCGKTTLLRLVNRLVEPTSGQVLLDGRDVAMVDPVELRRSIGYVIQQIGLFPHQTVADNVATVPRLLRWPAERIRRRVDDLLALVGLDPALVRGRYPAKLSGGERQRVGVARALAAEPPLLLMDEPFGAVDPIVRERLQDELLAIHRQLGMTVIFVTHDVDEAIKLGSRVAILRQGGRLAQYGPPAELLLRPADDYVARFVGADRALKRLALLTVGELALDSGASPVGSGVTISETLTARDALSLLLTLPAASATVVTDSGHPRGVLSVAAIAAALAADAARYSIEVPVAAPPDSIDYPGQPGS